MTLYYVGSAADDYYTNSVSGTQTGTTTLNVSYNSVINPAFYEQSYGKVDTSGIPDTDVISAATFYFTANTYNATTRVTKIYSAQIWTGSSYVFLTNATNKTWAAGTQTIVLTATEQGYINKTGTTNFRIITSDPGSKKYRQMLVNAYETSQATAMRLDVTHAAPAVSYTHAMVITS